MSGGSLRFQNLMGKGEGGSCLVIFLCNEASSLNFMYKNLQIACQSLFVMVVYRFGVEELEQKAC